MNIPSFTPASLKLLRESMDEAMAAVAQKHGIKLRVGRVTYEATNCKVVVEAATIGEGGEVVTKEAAEFRRSAHFLGLTEDHLFREFKNAQGKTCKLMGLRPRSDRMPFVIQIDGKLYTTTKDAVLRGFGLPTTRSLTAERAG